MRVRWLALMLLLGVPQSVTAAPILFDVDGGCAPCDQSHLFAPATLHLTAQATTELTLGQFWDHNYVPGDTFLAQMVTALTGTLTWDGVPMPLAFEPNTLLSGSWFSATSYNLHYLAFQADGHSYYIVQGQSSLLFEDMVPVDLTVTPVTVVPVTETASTLPLLLFGVTAAALLKVSRLSA